MKAKERIAKILIDAGYKNVQIEKQLPVYAPTYQGPKPRIADVYAEKYTDGPADSFGVFNVYVRKIDVCINGKYHSKGKDNRRNADLERIDVIPVPINLNWFKQGATTDSELLQHIEYQLQR